MNLKFKALSDGSLQIEGVGIPFGGPVSGKDLHGQYFSTKTDFGWDLIPDGHRPLLYQHGLDDTVSTNVIGRWSVKKIDDKGVWIQAQLNARSEYLEEIKELLDKDSLGLSSATMGHLVKVSGKSGEILRWPVVEMSLTPNPANPAAYVVKTAAAITPARYVAKLLAVKHGDHDQADHGNRGGGGSVAGPAADRIRMTAGNARYAASGLSSYERDAEGEDIQALSSTISGLREFAGHVRDGEIEKASETLAQTRRDADSIKDETIFEEASMALDDSEKDFRELVSLVENGKSFRKSRKHGDHDQADHGNRGGGGSSAGSTRMPDPGFDKEEDAYAAAGHLEKQINDFANPDSMSSVPNLPITATSRSTQESDGKHQAYVYATARSASDVDKIISTLNEYGYHAARDEDSTRGVVIQRAASLDQRRAAGEKSFRVSRKAEEVVASAPSEPVEVIEEAVEPVEYTENTLEGGLRELLSDVIAFYLEAHGAHWNVVGDDFKQFHDLFGDIYEDVQSSIDPLAENIRKLNAVAPFSLKDIAADPALSNASGSVNPEDLCEELYASNSVVLMKILSCFNMATSAGEQGIANFLADRQDMHKKWAWQLSASLDERGESDEPVEMEMAAPKSRKHGDHDQSDHGNRDGGGGSSGSGASHGDIAATARGASFEVDSIRESTSNLSKLDALRLDNVQKIISNIAERHNDRDREDGAGKPASGSSVDRSKSDVAKLAALIGNFDDEDIQADLRGVVDELRANVEGETEGYNKSFRNKATRTGRSAQPVARLAVKVGNAPVRKSIDLNELKMQVRAIARDAALKNLGRK